jgi:hypothetical protein
MRPATIIVLAVVLVAILMSAVVQFVLLGR